MNVSDFRIGVIYMYTSPNNKKYIGQTINEKSRKSHHKTDTIKGDTYFGKALQKYGFENFDYNVLIKFKPTVDIEKLKRVLDKLEQRYIKLYNSNNREFGYNLNKGGFGNIGYKHTEEMKEYLKTVPKTSYQIECLKLGRNSCIKSEETKLKMSGSHNKTKKKVEKYDLENNLLDTFNSIEDAARSIEGKVQKTKANKISACCNNYKNCKTIYGYIWKFNID